GELHRARRALIMKPMMPSALRDVRGEIERLADELVAELAKRDGFDGIADFARHLPVAVVSHLVGLPEEGRERMLVWAAATFDMLGPSNERGRAALPAMLEMIEYVTQLDRSRADGGKGGGGPVGRLRRAEPRHDDPRDRSPAPSARPASGAVRLAARGSEPHSGDGERGAAAPPPPRR